MKRHSLLCLPLLLSGIALASPTLSDPLQDQLIRAEASDRIDIYVVLKDQVETQRVIADAKTRSGSLASRHYHVLSEAKKLARTSQGPLIQALESGVARGEVLTFTPFWIHNAIAVKASPAFIDELGRRGDIKSIYWDAPITLTQPTHAIVPAEEQAQSVENGIALAGAPELWAMGIDGTGTLACDQDTGADGNHPAFADRWRGLEPGVDPAHAWFDPVYGETFPSDVQVHGTHTLGTILGDDGGSNQIGMAPGAKWIGTKTIDIPGGNIFTDAVAAFQWAADPDGNPATMEDVPDVINNSWGLSQSYYGSCLDDFNAAIDVAEAAGVVVIFAAGNEGRDGLRSPPNRIATEFNTFAVGALNQDGSSLAGFSSQGPSDCDNSTIKPEIAAVGNSVRSSMPGGGYGYLSGTSMAAPVISGAVLLLRQAFPEATPEEVKMSLYYTALDLGAAGEDNLYGKGAVDVAEAYYWLDDFLLSPNGRLVADFDVASCSDSLGVQVSDEDLTVPNINIMATSQSEAGGETFSIEATEALGKYEGMVHFSAASATDGDGYISVQHGDQVTLTYIDENDGEGGINIAKTAEIAIDCMAPTFAGLDGIKAGDFQVSLSWSAASDDLSVSYLVYRADSADGFDLESPLATTADLSYRDEDLQNGQTYYYMVRAVDAVGNIGPATPAIAATPQGPDRLFRDDFDAGQLSGDWTVDVNGRCASTWSVETCTGAEFCEGAYATMNWDSCRANQQIDMSLTTPEVDLRNYTSPELRFSQDFDAEPRVSAYVEYSTDGRNWTALDRYTRDNAYGPYSYDLSSLEGQNRVQFRFRYEQGGLLRSEWSLDSVEVIGWPQD